MSICKEQKIAQVSRPLGTYGLHYIWFYLLLQFGFAKSTPLRKITGNYLALKDKTTEQSFVKNNLHVQDTPKALPPNTKHPESFWSKKIPNIKKKKQHKHQQNFLKLTSDVWRARREKRPRWRWRWLGHLGPVTATRPALSPQNKPRGCCLRKKGTLLGVWGDPAPAWGTPGSFVAWGHHQEVTGRHFPQALASLHRQPARAALRKEMSLSEAPPPPFCHPFPPHSRAQLLPACHHAEGSQRLLEPSRPGPRRGLSGPHSPSCEQGTTLWGKIPSPAPKCPTWHRLSSQNTTFTPPMLHLRSDL